MNYTQTPRKSSVDPWLPSKLGVGPRESTRDRHLLRFFSLLLDEWSMDGGILGGSEADSTAFLMDFNGISMKFQWDFNDLFMEYRIIGLGTCPILRVGKGWYTPI